MTGTVQATEAVHEAVTAARQEGAEAAAAAAASEVAAVVSAAADRVEAAENARDQMADALAASAMVQRMEALERQIGEQGWHGHAERQTAILETLQATLQTLASAVALLTEVIVEELEETETPSTPGHSTSPGSNPQHADEPPATAPAKKRHRLI